MVARLQAQQAGSEGAEQCLNSAGGVRNEWGQVGLLVAIKSLEKN